ncbi:FecR family protein [Methyloceanibacter methanicus]|nr:FecR domain-containing protein [Methyloceanibacter methanicus]
MAQNGHTTPRRGAWAIALLIGAGLAFAVSVPAVSPPAYAGKVGVAAAVNPDAFSSLSGVPNKQLNIGKSIFYNERIETTTSGLVQVLLVDGSTFTVGPNSNLVIDKFVYDPKKKTGEVVATFSKGSMRFIGGKLSKNAGGVKVNTPSGALAIRGGMFQGNTQKKIYSFLYGHSMTLQGRNGKTHVVYQPGYTLDLSQGGGTVRPTTAEDTAVFSKALSNSGGSSSSGNGNGDGDGSGGSQGGQQQADSGTSQMTQTVSLQNLIADATATQIDEELKKQEDSSTTPPTTTPNDNPPTTPKVDARVIRVGPQGLVTDDFEWTFEIKNNRLVADVPAVNTDEGCESSDCIQITTVSSNTQTLEFDFPAKVTCATGLASAPSTAPK